LSLNVLFGRDVLGGIDQTGNQGNVQITTAANKITFTWDTVTAGATVTSVDLVLRGGLLIPEAELSPTPSTQPSVSTTPPPSVSTTSTPSVSTIPSTPSVSKIPSPSPFISSSPTTIPKTFFDFQVDENTVEVGFFYEGDDTDTDTHIDITEDPFLGARRTDESGVNFELIAPPQVELSDAKLIANQTIIVTYNRGQNEYNITLGPKVQGLDFQTLDLVPFNVSGSMLDNLELVDLYGQNVRSTLINILNTTSSENTRFNITAINNDESKFSHTFEVDNGRIILVERVPTPLASATPSAPPSVSTTPTDENKGGTKFQESQLGIGVMAGAAFFAVCIAAYVGMKCCKESRLGAERAQHNRSRTAQ
jgi:hypothetical protein